VTQVGGISLVGVSSKRGGRVQLGVKRVLDFMGAISLVVFLSPLILGIAAAIVINDGRPILFRQTRIGRGGRPFRILKFRTMSAGAEVAGESRVSAVQDGTIAIDAAVELIKSEATSCVTGLGGFLRQTSMDELPQLWNVLCGQMSLVGPRPLRPFEVASLSGWQVRRQDMRPGLTGLWQVMGRSEVSWAERMELDYSYVRHWSLRSDLGILLRTLPAVASRKGSM
jgi:lipopolysaccharide/colanic/teichoic acid biosynthesis glycosyltransferase